MYSPRLERCCTCPSIHARIATQTRMTIPISACDFNSREVLEGRRT